MNILSHPDIPDIFYIFFDKFAVNEKVFGLVFTRDVHMALERDVNDLRMFKLTGEVETEYVLKTCLALEWCNVDGVRSESLSPALDLLKQKICALLLSLQNQILYEYDSWNGWDVSVYMLKHYLCIARSYDLKLPLVESKLEQVLDSESQRRLKEHSARTIQRAWFKVWLNPYHPMGEKRMHHMISELKASGQERDDVLRSL